MGNTVQYIVNIAMESTILLLLIIMLITLFLQKRLFITTVPLIFLSGFISLLIVVQIATWTALLLRVPVVYGAMPVRILYILDYIFSYGATVAFYYYVEALVIDGYRCSGVTYKPRKNIKTILNTWGVVTTIIYSILLFVPSVYRLENGVATYSMPAYIMLNIITKFAVVCALIFVYRHRKVIDKHEFTLSFVFIVLVSALIIVDELYSFCIGHVLFALYVFVLYVGIDLRKGFLLERQEKEIVEWKTQIMLSQMQPHFIYNVLTTISSLCEMQNAIQARDVVNSFADYLRMNLNSIGEERKIPFEKELEYVKTYLWLEKIRFEDALNIVYEIGTTDFCVPSLSVQPMVENAVKHGIIPKDDPGTVKIKTYETKENYIIIVEDDGIGFDINSMEKDTRTHVGIENVRNRLEIISGGSCEVQSEIGKGTVVTIHIPKGD